MNIVESMIDLSHELSICPTNSYNFSLCWTNRLRCEFILSHCWECSSHIGFYLVVPLRIHFLYPCIILKREFTHYSWPLCFKFSLRHGGRYQITKLPRKVFVLHISLCIALEKPTIKIMDTLGKHYFCCL